MRVDVLTVQSCPNAPVIEARVVEALTGRDDVDVVRREVVDAEQAARLSMHGSPTPLVDGHDPFAAPGTPTSFACRLYRAADGRTDGAPSVEGPPRPGRRAGNRRGGRALGRAGRSRRAGRAGPARPGKGGPRAVQQAVLRAFACGIGPLPARHRG
ncbi:hypothetical protein ACIBSV_07840 [Embleya sp. NPDC050154]|uniref:hypothetical protein n=1 Tax=unclassified Embleya TaxID=2699296 RepID=UPI00378F44CF